MYIFFNKNISSDCNEYIISGSITDFPNKEAIKISKPCVIEVTCITNNQGKIQRYFKRKSLKSFDRTKRIINILSSSDEVQTKISKDEYMIKRTTPQEKSICRGFVISKEIYDLISNS